MADGDERGTQGSPRGSDDASIWSTDEIPVHADPLEIVWNRPERSVDAPVTLSQPRNPDDPSAPGTPEAPAEPGGRSGANDRRTRLLITAAAVLAIAVVGGLLVRTGTGDDSAANPTVPDTASESDTVPATTMPGTIAPVGDPTDDDAAPTPSLPSRVELPPLVGAIERPTEVIALSADGYVHTLSLPSGRVTSVPVSGSGSDPFGFGGNQIIVAPDAAAIGLVDGEFVVLPRVGPPVGVEYGDFGDGVGGIETVGWRTGDDGATRFVVAIYPSDSGDVRVVSIDTAGTLEERTRSDVDFFGRFGRFGPTVTAPDGSWIVNDAGGAYAVEPDGSARRIEDGIVYAVSDDHRLVRDCDESQACSTVLVTPSTGERRVLDPAVLPDDFADLVYGLALAPDGSAALAQRSTFASSRVLVDFQAGEVADWPMMNWSQASTWAADSSGVFDASSDGDGLSFTTRTGESVTFADELGSIVALGVRRPDAELGPTANVVESAAVPARPLEATGLVLAAAGRAGGMSSIDLDAGVVSSWATSGRLGADGALVPDAASIVALPVSDAVAYATSPDTETELGADFAVEGPKFAGPVPGTIWVPAPGIVPAMSTFAYQLVRVDGAPTGDLTTSFAFPDAELLGSDGRGGLVVTRGGTVFTLGVDGANLLTTGDLVAIGADTAYVRECADIVACEVLRLDRQTGERTPVEGLGELSPVAIAPDERGIALGTSVAPGGDVLVVEVRSPGERRWAMFDTATVTGRLPELTDLAIAQPVIWNADVSFAAFLAGSSLAVYDRAAQDVVAVDTVSLRAIGPAPSGW